MDYFGLLMWQASQCWRICFVKHEKRVKNRQVISLYHTHFDENIIFRNYLQFNNLCPRDEKYFIISIL